MSIEEILKELVKINEQLTEDTIKSATKEELEEYLKLTDAIKVKLKMLD